jgi:hypothetical protein
VQEFVETQLLIVYPTPAMVTVPVQLVLKSEPETQVTEVPLVSTRPTPPPIRILPPFPAPTPVCQLVSNDVPESHCIQLAAQGPMAEFDVVTVPMGERDVKMAEICPGLVVLLPPQG